MAISDTTQQPDQDAQELQDEDLDQVSGGVEGVLHASIDPAVALTKEVGNAKLIL
jgi:hypothetical protein